MSKRRLLPLLAGVAMLLPLAPALAALQVRYDGTALIRFNASSVWTYPGALNGTYGFGATFYYDDVGNQHAATLRVDGIVRAHYPVCPGIGLGYCPALSLGPAAIGSAVGSTLEDYITTYVGSPGGFGGVPLPGALPRRYDLVAADDSFASLAWALFDNASGFAWNSGSGTVDSITLSVPEPASWLMMVAGFGLVGAVLRRRSVPVST